jgi:flagellar hook-length control protein FliK
LPHDPQAAASDDSPASQPQTDNSGNVVQVVPQTTTPMAASAAAMTAATSAAMASAHGADITAQLAAQITSRAGAARTAFDFALEPQGLGRVDVSLKIDSQGQLSATLSFDNPNAAAEARGRAGDLQQALQQAGFDIGQSGLSFTSGGSGQGAAGQGQAQSNYATAPVLADTPVDAITASTSALGASSAGGLDITI